MICKNCQAELEGNYCSRCGQKTSTARLDWSHLWEEVQYTFFHFNGGFSYTLKQLVTRPGLAAKEYIEGKRVKHYKPFLMMFVLAGLYGLLMHFVDISSFFAQLGGNDATIQLQNSIYEWQVSHYSLIEVLSLPVFSLASFIAFKRWNYNLVEHIVLNCFAASTRLLLGIATFPILYFGLDSAHPVVIRVVTGIATISVTFITYWQFFREPGRLLFWRFVLLTALLAAMLILILVAFTLYLLGNHREILAN